MVRRVVTADQEAAWALAPLLAGRSRVRVGRWNGRRAKWEYSSRDERDLTEKLGARVAIQHSAAGKGRLVVSYNSLDELDGILAHIR